MLYVHLCSRLPVRNLRPVLALLLLLLLVPHPFSASAFALPQETQPSANAPTTGVAEVSSLEIDPALLLELQCVWQIIGSDHNPVWPGWDARKTPVLFYLPDVQDVLLNHPSPPNDFLPYTGPLADAFPSMLVRNGKTEFAFDGQNTSRVLFGEQTLIVADTLSNRKNWLRGWASSTTELEQRLVDLEYPSLRADPYQQMEMIAHEAFHVFQYKHLGHDLGNDHNARFYPCLSVEGNVLLALEGKAMVASITAPTVQASHEFALQWLALRLKRRQDMTKEAQGFEDDNEFMEGLATYAGLRCLEELEGQSWPPALDYIQGFHGLSDMSGSRAKQLALLTRSMRGEVNVNNDLYGVAPARKRMYSSGLGIALMLDRLAEATWEEEIALPHQTMTGLVEKILSPSQQQLAAALFEARKDPELEELYRRKETLAANGKADTQKMVDGILMGTTSRVAFDWSEFPSQQRGLSYTSFGLRRVDDDQVIYTLVPIQMQLANQAGGFQQRIPRPTLDNLQRQLVTFPLSSSIDQHWLSERLGQENEGTWEIANLNLELPGATIQAQKAKLIWDGSCLTIKPYRLPVAREGDESVPE